MRNKERNKKCPCCNKTFYNKHGYPFPRWDKIIHCSRQCRGIASRKNVPIKCETCSKEFYVKPSRKKRYNSKFCSMKCRAHKIKATCLTCGVEYHAQRWQDGKTKYCSRACQSEAKKQMKGYWLGKKRPDLKLPQHWKSGSEHPYWKGGVSRLDTKTRHSYEYQQWRKEVFERDKVCVICGSDKQLQADHIKSFRDYPDLRFDLSNGRVLCYPCHKQTPSYGFFPKKEGFYPNKI